MIDISTKTIASTHGCDVYYDDNKNNDNNSIPIKIRAAVCPNDTNTPAGLKM